MSGAGVILRLCLATMPRLHTTSPLSRSVGAGLGGEGSSLTFPPAPFLSRAADEEGGGERSDGDPAPVSCNDAEATNQITPLPQCRSGAGGEGSSLTFPPAPFLSRAADEEGEVSGAMAILRLCLATMPRPPTRSPRSRSAGAGLGVRAAPSPSPRPPSSPALRARKGEVSGVVVTWVLHCSPPTCGRGRGR